MNYLKQQELVRDLDSKLSTLILAEKPTISVQNEYNKAREVLNTKRQDIIVNIQNQLNDRLHASMQTMIEHITRYDGVKIKIKSGNFSKKWLDALSVFSGSETFKHRGEQYTFTYSPSYSSDKVFIKFEVKSNGFTSEDSKELCKLKASVIHTPVDSSIYELKAASLNRVQEMNKIEAFKKLKQELQRLKEELNNDLAITEIQDYHKIRL